MLMAEIHRTFMPISKLFLEGVGSCATQLALLHSRVSCAFDRAAMLRTRRSRLGGAVMNKMELSMQPSTGQRNSPEYTTAPISNYPSAAQSQKQSKSEAYRQE
jgi:hypothetical protein